MMIVIRHRARVAVAALLVAVALGLPVAAQHETVDLDAIYKIKEEGFQRSQVMDILSYLTDIHGPRLTNSPNYRKAADWAIAKMKEWGLINPRTEKWQDEFGRGWSNDRFYAMAVSPQAFPLIAYPLAWTPGTNGPTTGDAVLAVISTEADFEKFRVKLKGKFILTQDAADVRAWFDAPGHRFTEQELEDMEKQPEPAPEPGRQQAGPFGPGGPGQPNFQAVQAFNRKRTEFFAQEGVAALPQPGRGRGDHGSVLVGGGGSRNPKDPVGPPQVDNHCGAAVCVAPDGTIHLVIGSHHGSFQHFELPPASSPDAWRLNEAKLGEGATYPSLVCDSAGTLNLAYRCRGLRGQTKAHYKRGGVITISWHPDNPLTMQDIASKSRRQGGTAWDVSSKEVVASILPGGINHEIFNSWLERLAIFFIGLTDDDGTPIPVIFRPYHEHSGSFLVGNRYLHRQGVFGSVAVHCTVSARQKEHS